VNPGNTKDLYFTVLFSIVFKSMLSSLFYPYLKVVSFRGAYYNGESMSCKYFVWNRQMFSPYLGMTDSHFDSHDLSTAGSRFYCPEK